VQDYYRALAQQKRGNSAESKATFERLIEVAGRELARQAPDAESSSRAERRPSSRTALAHYVSGLGHLGLGQKDAAKAEFRAALEASPDLLGARTALP